MTMNRREFLQNAGLVGGAIAAKYASAPLSGLVFESLWIPRQESLELPKDHTLPLERILQDGWYVQCIVNEQEKGAESVRKALIDAGISNIYHLPVGEQFKTFVGKFASLEDAIETAKRIKPALKQQDINEVGIIESNNGGIDWKYSLPLTEEPSQQTSRPTLDALIKGNAPAWQDMPRQLYDLIGQKTAFYNQREGISIDPDFVRAIAKAENQKYDSAAIGYKAEGIVLKNGEVVFLQVMKDGKKIKKGLGVMQVTPIAAEDVGVDLAKWNWKNPEVNVDTSLRIIAKLYKMFDGNHELIAAAYNAGYPRVLEANGIPNILETKQFVPKVLSYYNRAKTLTANN